ncbi:MAG TPA: hypothetical protein VHK86_08155 [Nitrososphaera sp.]|nr:hypothetical protein [Nitrososphaera sp.]HEX2613915.1 hypothetical protein [Nitrososphaera sp.]
MNLDSILTRRRFAIFASIAVAASFWLSTTAVNSCSNSIIGSTFQCKNDVLVVFLIEHKKWPYQDIPFVGYWDSFDNKFTSFAAEPHSRLLLAGVFVYLVWLRAIVYVEKKGIRRKASISHLD